MTFARINEKMVFRMNEVIYVLLLHIIFSLALMKMFNMMSNIFAIVTIRKFHCLQKNVEGHVEVQRIKQIFIILQFNRNNKCVRNTFYWHFSLSDRYNYSKKS